MRRRLSPLAPALGPHETRPAYSAARLAARLGALALVVLLALALGATGFAHRAPSGSEAARDAYRLAGGVLHQICGDQDSDGKAAREACPLCHLAQAAPLPNPPAGLSPAALALPLALGAGPGRWVAGLWQAAGPRARGPPRLI